MREPDKIRVMAQVTLNSCQFPASSLGDLNRLQEARDMLRLAMEKFPSDEIIPYDLACVCCALGRLEEAHEWLRRAMDIGGKEIRLRALGDPDLEPLWNEIGEI